MGVSKPRKGVAPKAVAKKRRRPSGGPQAQARREGRPPTYHESFVRRAYKLALLGMVDDEIAEQFDITPRAFQAWKVKHPEFKQALIDGREEADADVAQSLYRRAVGGVIIKREYVSDPDKPDAPRVLKVTEQEVPGDLSAAKLWMHNRQRPRGRWSSNPDESTGAAIGAGFGAILASLDGATRGLQGAGAFGPQDRPDDEDDE